ncbi:MAG: DUF962 domain-containing protein [Bacteriovoracaceae bacterium]|jgi:hypothetical protein|nr:DUF962 domain-containing protein [Bacteriovoracaceae bacterium]
MNKQFQSFDEFYPFYLKEHSDKTNRLLHFIGTTLVIMIVIGAFLTNNFYSLLYCPFVGYGFAWIGHFRFEKNKPATFKYPLYSFRADFLMWWQLLTRKLYF